mgnify:CR=1 FL=1
MLVLAPHAVACQSATEPPQAVAWRFPAAIGMTDFDHDADGPGSITLFGVERRLVRRLAVGAELGFGTTDRIGQCGVGSFQFECVKAEYWPSFGVGTSLRVFQLGEASTGLLGQVGWSGPDTRQFYDAGLFARFETVGSLDVGFEFRRRYGDTAGTLYLFRIARRLGAGPAD